MTYAHAGTTVLISDISNHSPQYPMADSLLGSKLLLTEEPYEVTYEESVHSKWFVLIGYIGMDKVKVEGVRYGV